ncbi:MAG: potassium channel family protein [Methanobrevibacter sp.]|jgi:voltage-gated potassium channel|nr:potassium channel family protein [Candidatus Methanoflexus mossambicus]
MDLNRSNSYYLFLMVLILFDCILLLSGVFYIYPANMYNFIVIFDLIVCIVLTIDFYRGYKHSEDKNYLKHNWYYIIALIPDLLFNWIFLSLGLINVTWIIRFIRLIRFFRVLILFRKDIKLFTDFIKETQLDKLLMAVVVLVLLSAIFLLFFDSSFDNLSNSLWYVLVTLLTIGYGDMIPDTMLGRVIGVMIMVVGFSLLSILTAAISSIYTRRIQNEEEIYLTKQINDLKNEIHKLNKKLEEHDEKIGGKIDNKQDNEKNGENNIEFDDK